jgi:hypothetical protein
LEQEFQIESIKNNISRARSITAGSCFNGIVEIIMRGDGNRYLWTPLTPSETGELIHQLAASIGCTAVIAPRTDFLSNRQWVNIQQEKE